MEEETVPAGFPAEWVSISFHTLRRVVYLDFPPPAPRVLPRSLGILIPDVTLEQRTPENALFFDLETTGLSGGAGTVAFLAAFGRFVRDTASSGDVAVPMRLRVAQYLLLDYPGESDFLTALLSEFAADGTTVGVSPVVVSYNGKTFDAPLLKTRCLMQGIKPPEYGHADLLHLSRRLWKRVLPNCSLGEIETSILGLDRTGDMPGALAPEVWFAFLRTGKTEDLLRICEHNIRDIAGLAHLFAAAIRLAEKPLETAETLACDMENLALHWRKTLRRAGSTFTREDWETGAELLARAAARGHPRALLLVARDRLREARRSEGLDCLTRLIEGDNPAPLKAAAYRLLAIDAEWHGRDCQTALAATEAALALEGLSPSLRNDLERRRRRLSCSKNFC
jgi:uncharacterized protein YprB with RNaseH-like and TPR domain